MKRISPLEQEYKNMKRQDAPDLWSRIEERLEEHPERSLSRDREENEKEQENRRIRRSHRGRSAFSGRIVFGAAASIAAVFLLMVASPWYGDLLSVRKGSTLTENPEDFYGEAGRAAETTASSPENYLTSQETLSQDRSPAMEESAVPVEKDTLTEENHPAKMAEKSHAAPGVLLYSQLELADYESLSLPAQAETLSHDAMYFSEDVLEDTELLCVGTVLSVSLETHESHGPALLVYDLLVDSVCCSEDYATDLTHIQVKSPVVEAVGGENQILYQLQVDSSYVLPLRDEENGWELLFPFAPQIQVTPGGGYLFHSGYASLIDDSAFVVVGQQEGDNDFYYDRMLFRDDGDFLSDLVTVVKNQSLSVGKG